MVDPTDIHKGEWGSLGATWPMFDEGERGQKGKMRPPPERCCGHETLVLQT